jgi:signal transduction histidine kinase
MGAGYMNDEANVDTVLSSDLWRMFLKSTAGALQTHLVSYHTKTERLLSACAVCPICGEEIPFFTPEETQTRILQISDDQAPACISNQQDNYAGFGIEHHTKILMRRCDHCAYGCGLSLIDSATVAKELIRFVIKALQEGWDHAQITKELFVLRRAIRILLTKCRNDNRYLNRALDLILSTAVILLQAGGGWLKYVSDENTGLLIKGDCDTTTAVWSLMDRRTVVAELNHCGVSGQLGMEDPADFETAGFVLKEMALECEAAFLADRFMQKLSFKIGLTTEPVGSGILAIDPAMQLSFINQAAMKMLEVSATEWPSLTVEDVSAPWSSCILKRTNQPKRGIKDRLKDRYVNWSVYPIRETGDPEGWIVLIDDETDAYRILELERQTEKAANTSVLLSALAHEIRNPLATFRGLFQLVRQREPSDDIARYIDLGIKEVDRVTRLINEFLLMKKPPEYASEQLDLRQFLYEILPILNGELEGRSVQINTDFEEVPSISADPEQLTQVMINLVRNAYEAMDEDGRIVLTLRNIQNEWAEITVRDSGPGISPEAEGKVFEPFFSTKIQGTGLGLSICRIIIHNHNGEISVKSHPEGGAVFTILLPVGESRKKRDQIDALLIMDDEMLRLAIEQVLRAEKRTVLSVSRLDHADFVMNQYDFSVTVIDGAIVKPSEYGKLSRWPSHIVLLVSEKEEAMKELAFAVCFEKPLNYAKFLGYICDLI